MAKTLFIVVKSLLAFAGVEVSEDTAKQIRQVCTWANVKFTFPVLEDAVMDFYMLSLKYWRQLHKCGVHPTDDWLARNMVRAFRQNRDENKFGGIVGLLQAYITQEATTLLKGEVSSVDFHLDPTKKTFEDHINNWILKGIFVNVKAEDLRVRLATLFNLAENQVIMRTSKEGAVESFRLVLAAEKKINARLAAIATGKSVPGYDENQEPANIDDQNFIEQETAAEDEANGADAVGATIGEEETCAVTDSTMPVGPLAQNPMAAVNPALKRLAAAAITAPLAQPKAEEVKATGNTVAPITADITKAAETIGTSLEEFQKKYAAAENIPRFAIRLAQTEEVRARRRACKTKEDYKGIDPLSDISIIEMLMSPDAKYNWLRSAALGKSVWKSSAPDWREKYEKSDFFLCVCHGEYSLVHRIPAKDEIVGDNKYYSLRLWILKDSMEPEGMIYTGDQAQNPFLRFKWGFARNGLSFPLPKVERKIPGTREYAPLPEEMKGVAEAIRKALVEKNCIPKRKPRPSDLGITLQSNWGTRVVNQ